MRILDLSFHYDDELVRVLSDAGTPPNDREDFQSALQGLRDAHDPRTMLHAIPSIRGVLEFVFVAPPSGHRYGVIFQDLDHVADAIAYWRDPPLYEDPRYLRPHGHSRERAIELAIQRRGRARHGEAT